MPLTRPTTRPMPSPTGMRPADRRRYHGGGRQCPGHRQIDLADQDDDHHPGSHDAEESADLQLLQQIGRRQQRGTAEMSDRITGTRHQADEHEQGRNEDRAVVARQADPHRYNSSAFLTSSMPSAPMLTATSKISPSNSGCSRGANVEDMEEEGNDAFRTSSPLSEPEPESFIPPNGTSGNANGFDADLTALHQRALAFR
jgi:hypothetical protein